MVGRAVITPERRALGRPRLSIALSKRTTSMYFGSVAMRSVLDVIRTHFGEEPSEELASSLQGKVTPRLEDLYSSYMSLAKRQNQNKPSNTLRLFVFMPQRNNGMIIGRKVAGAFAMSEFRHLLLYCHSVAFEDRLCHAIWQELTGQGNAGSSADPLLVSVSSVVSYYSSYFGS
jgi:hypothetical protein